MRGDELLKVSPEVPQWQDYRSSSIAMVVFYAGDPISELPIREVPEELPSAVVQDPHYESGTYGLYACARSQIRNAFVKSKTRYLVFLTRYVGTKADFRDKYFITGYYLVAKTADVKKLHIRYGTDYSCIDEQSCPALRASERRFVAIEDAFAVTDAVMKSWNFNGRVTRQTRVVLDEQKTAEVIDYLKSKPDATALYTAETTRLQPHIAEETAEEEA
jgi:hypothetical protein